MRDDRQLTLSRSAPSHRNYSVALRRRNIYTDTLVSVSVFYIILNNDEQNNTIHFLEHLKKEASKFNLLLSSSWLV